MSYSNEKAYDILLILGECRGTFATAERLWREYYPDRTRETFFHVWLNESQLKVSFILNITKLHRSVVQLRDERTAEILASTELNPYDSLR